MKKYIGILGIAFLGGSIALGGYKLLVETPTKVEQATRTPLPSIVNTRHETAFTNTATNTVDFTEAAEIAIHRVVHVKNTAVRTQSNPWAEFFYGNRNGTRKYEQVGTGSGVIISPDGYIVTNNHVVEGATSLEVTLNNQKKYDAVLIGKDAKNDIALLKIEVDFKLPYSTFANSDAIKIGEWVLAVGNPYNLTSTVTAGIISAKGRDLAGNNNIESFIQTDAAVNPGNSGGALVNTRGELIGINTAISSGTGSFIGYSFAVPSNIAKKIVDDILEFGKVQEAVLGISIDASYQEEGVKIASVLEEIEGAKPTGLRKGDIIKKINKVKIAKFSDLKGQLTAKRPGESVLVTIDRNGKELVKKVALSKSIERYISSVFQWELKNLSKSEKKKTGLKTGVKIVRTGKDEEEGTLKGYIITTVNGEEVTDAAKTAKLLDTLASNRYRITIEIINLEGEKEKYIYR